MTFAVTAGSCTVSGTTLTLTSTGSCTFKASAAAFGDYAAAPDVVRTFLIDLDNVWKQTRDAATQAATLMTQARSYHTATRLNNGTVLITGGLDASGAPLQSTEIYDPATGRFTAAGTMPSKSVNHTATLLPSGKVLILGGGNSSAQLFTPGTGTWAAGGSMGSNRSYHTATLLGNGKVLVAGGADQSGKTLGTTLLYNPADGTFVTGPAGLDARERHTATLLSNGKALIVGGRVASNKGYTALASYQICDATACTASTGGVAARHSHAAASLGLDGSKVLVAGGANGNSDLATADLYDFIAGTWTSTGLGALRAAPSLTLSEAPNGRALAAGGSSVGMAKNQADFYTPPLAPVVPMNVLRAGHTATPLEDVNGRSPASS